MKKKLQRISCPGGAAKLFVTISRAKHQKIARLARSEGKTMSRWVDEMIDLGLETAHRSGMKKASGQSLGT